MGALLYMPESVTQCLLVSHATNTESCMMIDHYYYNYYDIFGLYHDFLNFIFLFKKILFKTKKV